MTLLSAHGDQLLDKRDDDEHGSKKYSRNHFGLLRHPLVGLMVETRPTLLEDHRCAPRLVQDHPELKWIFEKPDLFPPTRLFHLRQGIYTCHRNLFRIESTSVDF